MPRKKLPTTMPLDIVNVTESYLQGYFECPFYGEEDRKIKERVIVNITTDWHGAFHHFLNSQCTLNLEFPGNKNFKTATKPRGELLNKTFTLCKECHAMQGMTGVDIPWKNASIWFSKCYWDFIGTEIEETLKDEPGDLNVYNNNYKEAVIERRFVKLRAMRGGMNPYKDFKNATGLIFLINAATALSASPLKSFNKDCWKPFLTAFSEEAIEMKSNRWAWSRFENDFYRQSSGRGRPKNLE